MKQGGVVAFVCANSELYNGKMGPLENRHRLHAVTPVTVGFLLHRAQFTDVAVEIADKMMRVSCKKI